MGCLFEFFGELFLEVFLEGSITILGNIFPSVSENPKRQQRLKTVVTFVSCLLVIAMFFGALLLIFGENMMEENLGLLLLLVPAAIIALYIIFCLVGASVVGRSKGANGKGKKKK